MNPEENEPLDDFVVVIEEMIVAIQNIIDKSWIEITKAGCFDASKLSEHENFVALFDRFQDKYNRLEF